MKQASRISWSRSFHGSRPSTLSSPWYEVSPRIALSAVVLPAPLGPMSPRMRPSSTRRSTPSSATVVPNVLRRPRASMHAMASALLFGGIRLRGLRRRGLRRRPRAIQEFFRLQAKPLDGGLDPRPLFAQELLPLALQQQAARAGIDEHAKAAPGLDQPLVHQFLIALQDRERIDPIFGRDRAYGGQRIAFLKHAVQYHRDHPVAQLAVDRLIVVPLTVHHVFQYASTMTYLTKWRT